MIRGSSVCKIGVLVCGNSGLDYIEHNDNIEIVRLILNIDGKEYEDFIDISCDEFYKVITDNRNTKTFTSQTPTGVIVDKLEKMKKNGYTDIIIIGISAKLSGIFSGMILASSMVEGLNYYPFDSKSLSYGEGYLALEASKMAKSGCSVSEILNRLEYLRSNTKLYVCVDTLHYLVLSGRLGQISGILGTLLQLKPLITVDDTGALKIIEKIRTKKKAVKIMISKVCDQIAGKKIILCGAYTNNEDEVLEILNEIKVESSADIVELITVPLTPVVGSHAGPKTLGVGYIIL